MHIIVLKVKGTRHFILLCTSLSVDLILEASKTMSFTLQGR